MKVKFVFKKHTIMTEGLKRYSITKNCIILYYEYGEKQTIDSKDLQLVLPIFE